MRIIFSRHLLLCLQYLSLHRARLLSTLFRDRIRHRKLGHERIRMLIALHLRLGPQELRERMFCQLVVSSLIVYRKDVAMLSKQRVRMVRPPRTKFPLTS